MSYEYIAEFRIDLGKAIPEVGDLLSRVNDATSSCGYNERLKCLSGPITATITADRELTEEEQHKMKTILEAQMIESMPKQDIRLFSFRRKSGNVSQSVMQ